MLSKRITRRILRVTAVVLGVLVILMTAFHFWFISNAPGILQDLVNSKSKGKLHLEIKKFRFNWFTYNMDLKDAVFYSTDTATATTGYRFTVSDLNVTVDAILPLVFKKQIIIDSISLVDPTIVITKYKARDSLATKSTNDSTLSIPKEMGRIYNSINDALQVLQVSKFQIDNGKFVLLNKANTDEAPIAISNIFFHLDNLQVDSSAARGKEKILFSDNVILRTHHQDIIFPDGRHRVKFAQFRINLKKRLMEFDSCTIMAGRGDSANSQFRIFFDKLSLTNIDFDSLYRYDFIKADSVYCINPQFRLNVETTKKTVGLKPPKLDEVIKQLTGDMHLNFVVVQSASFNITTIRDGVPSSFTSNDNNFQLEGLRVKQDAKRALTIDRFVMAIRNYENFLRDSSYSMSFDSILFNNSRISLSNFAFKETRNGKVGNSFSMPQFELQGLSWDDLIFDRYFSADNVALLKPVITFIVAKNNNAKKQNVFEALEGIGKIMRLNNISIVDGDVKIIFQGNASLRLQNTNLSVLGSDLVASKRFSGIQHAIPDLNFKKGTYTSGNLVANLDYVSFNGNTGKLQANAIVLRDPSSIKANINGVTINAMSVDAEGHTIVDGVMWDKADLQLMKLGGGKGDSRSEFYIKNLSGKNTRLTIDDPSKKVNLSVQLKTLKADEINKMVNKKMSLKGLAFVGNSFQYRTGSNLLSISDINFRDLNFSFLQKIKFTALTPTDTINASIPEITMVPDLNAILNGTIKADAIVVKSPVVTASMSYHVKEPGQPALLPQLSIKKLTIEQPLLDIVKSTAQKPMLLQWDGKKSANNIVLNNLNVGGKDDPSISLSMLKVSLANFLFSNGKGQTYNSSEGKMDLTIVDLKVKQDETNAWDWKARVQELIANKFKLDSLGHDEGSMMLESANIRDLAVGSSLVLDAKELVKQNASFSVRNFTGSYHTNKNLIDWYNINYFKQDRTFRMDSFYLRPSLEKEAFAAAHPYQKDHVTLRTGSIEAGPFNLDRYLQDTIIDAGMVSMTNVLFQNYRDQRPPRAPSEIKRLPAILIKDLPIKLVIDTVKLVNAVIEYEEMNAKTNKSGVVRIDDLNGRITHLRNFDLTPTDSLEIRASANIAGVIPTRLVMKESYFDSLGGFLLTARMGSADLTALNPILTPLLSAELRSGILDTLTMRVVGREYLAFGTMQMYYHDLKINLFKKGDRENKTFVTGVLNFFANTLIKNKNTSRTGNIFFERLRDRSAANYMFKMTLSGVTSSVGVKSNRKLMRRYKKEIDRRDLPPIEL